MKVRPALYTLAGQSEIEAIFELNVRPKRADAGIRPYKRSNLRL